MTNKYCAVCQKQLEGEGRKYCSKSCRKAMENHRIAYKRQARKAIAESDDRLRSKLLYRLGKIDALVDELEKRGAELPIVIEKTQNVQYVDVEE